MPQFWSIAIACGLPMAVSQAALISIVPMAMRAGASSAKAAMILSVYGLMAISGKLLLSIIADKVDRILLLTANFCLGAVGIGLLATNHEYAMLLVCAGVVGLSSGVLTPLHSALVAERFGPSSFGTVGGLMAPIIAILCAILARFAGEIFDRTGGYALAFESFVGLQLLASALIFATRFARPADAVSPPLATTEAAA